MRKIEHIVIHCSATKEGEEFDANDIDGWHRNIGWDCIGYHYVIKINGEIEIGRPEEMIGSHVKGYNSNSIGIVYIGGLDKERNSKDTRTYNQKESLIKLIKKIKNRYPLSKILGHRDFPNVKKYCPSFDAKLEYKDI